MEYDVTPLIAGNGTYSLDIGPTPTTDGTVYSSREATTNKPQLVVTTTTSADTQAPSAPSALSATAASSGQVNLSWTASSDNVGVAGYEIWRGPSGGTLAKIATSTGTGTTYSDTTVAASTAYDYQVKAFDGATPPNVSTPSNTASVTTPAAAATLTFNPVAD